MRHYITVAMGQLSVGYQCALCKLDALCAQLKEDYGFDTKSAQQSVCYTSWYYKEQEHSLSSLKNGSHLATTSALAAGCLSYVCIINYILLASFTRHKGALRSYALREGLHVAPTAHDDTTKKWNETRASQACFSV